MQAHIDKLEERMDARLADLNELPPMAAEVEAVQELQNLIRCVPLGVCLCVCALVYVCMWLQNLMRCMR